MPNLSLRKIVQRYGDVAAVTGGDLEIASGEFVSFLGPSGCGKTTTLRMIAGFIDPSEGTIELDGQVLSSPAGSVPPERRGMSMIFQSYATWPNMTVAGERGLWPEAAEAEPVPKRDEKVGTMLKTVQLSHLQDRCPAELSGGQQQRVALARASWCSRAVLLLDEPLSNLDANLREEMRSEIKPLHDNVCHHHRLRHARPSRDDGNVGPHRGDEPGPRGADRRSLHALYQTADALRRQLHRTDQSRPRYTNGRGHRLRPIRDQGVHSSARSHPARHLPSQSGPRTSPASAIALIR